MTIYAAATGEYETLRKPQGVLTVSTTAGQFDSVAADASPISGLETNVHELVFTSALSTFWFHTSYFMANFSGPDAGAIWTFANGTGTNPGELRIRAKGTGSTSNNIILIMEKTTNGTTWTQLGTVEYSFQFNVLVALDIHVSFHASTGFVRFYKNGLLVMSFTGNTSSQNNAADRVVLTGTNASSSYSRNSEMLISNVCTIGYKMQTQKPNAAGNYTAWTGAYTAIDETPYDENDYIYSNTNDAKFSYNFENTSSTVQGNREVKALVAWAGTHVAEGSTPGDIRLFVRVASTDYEDGDANILSDGSFSEARAIWETNPNTSAAWTTGNIDGAEIGLKAVA